MWLLRFRRSTALLCLPDSEDPDGAFAVDDGRPAGPLECRGAEDDDVEDDDDDDEDEELCPDDFPPPAG